MPLLRQQPGRSEPTTPTHPPLSAPGSDPNPFFPNQARSGYSARFSNDSRLPQQARAILRGTGVPVSALFLHGRPPDETHAHFETGSEFQVFLAKPPSPSIDRKCQAE